MLKDEKQLKKGVFDVTISYLLDNYHYILTFIKIFIFEAKDVQLSSIHVIILHI